MKNGDTVCRGISWSMIGIGHIRAVSEDSVWVDFGLTRELKTGWWRKEQVTKMEHDWLAHKEEFNCN